MRAGVETHLRAGRVRNRRGSRIQQKKKREGKVYAMRAEKGDFPSLWLYWERGLLLISEGFKNKPHEERCGKAQFPVHGPVSKRLVLD